MGGRDSLEFDDDFGETYVRAENRQTVVNEGVGCSTDKEKPESC